MNIKLQKSKKNKFYFSLMPEKIEVKKETKYQSIDIISLGTVKFPKGTGVDSLSWSGQFFGEEHKDYPGVKKGKWSSPETCIENLSKYRDDNATLNVVITDGDTGLDFNMDMTISSFDYTYSGAYGDVSYTIKLEQKKELVVHTTKELKIAKAKKKKKKKKARAKSTVEPKKGTYTVKSGDTLSKIAAKNCGGASKWPKLYDKNKSIIESTAKKHKFKDSDHGHWIFPGTVLTLV